MKNNIGHKIQLGMYLAKIPDSYYESKKDIIINDATKKTLRENYLRDGDYLEVVAKGEDCVFANVGDQILISSRGIEHVKLNDHEEPFFLLRENEIRLVKDAK